MHSCALKQKQKAKRLSCIFSGSQNPPIGGCLWLWLQHELWETVTSPCPGSLCSCFLVVLLSWERFDALVISLRKYKELYNLGLLSSSSRILSHDGRVHKSHMRWSFFQAAGAFRITIWGHSESLHSEPWEAWHLLQRGIWLPIWQLLKECSLSEFQWFSGITLTPSHKKS